jgi:cell division protease FtsH
VIGLVHCGQRQNPAFLGAEGALQRDCSEQTAREIDEEVKKLLDEAYAAARRILVEHRPQLELVAGELLKKESLDAQAFNALLGYPALEPAKQAQPSANGQEERQLVPG